MSNSELVSTVAGLQVNEGIANGLEYFRVGDGPPIVLFAALGPTNHLSRGWQRRIEIGHLKPLARHFTVYSINRRPNLPEGVTMKEIAADLAGAVRSLFGQPMDFVGASTGGSQVLQFALDYPALVRRVVVIASGARLSDSSRAACERACVFAEQGRPRAAQAAIAAAIAGPGLKRTLMGGMMWLSAGVVGLTRNWDYRDMVRTMRADNAFDVTERLPEIEKPTLIINGTTDPSYPRSMSQLLVDRIPNARLIEYPGDHAGVLTDRRLWRDVTAFLQA